MRRYGFSLFAIVLLGLFTAALRGAAAVTNTSPDFKEVYELLRANLAGVDEADLNRAAVQGLLSELQPRVALAGEPDATTAATNASAVIRTALFDGAYGYVRVGQVGAGLDTQLAQAFKELASTNQLKGIVIDLRFASGQDYATAAAAADWFFTTEQPLIDWGEGLKKSTAKTNAPSLPVTLLINHKTSGSAEAFAGILRDGDVGLLIGAHTAGRANISKEFTLKNGQRLRVSIAPVKLGKGQPLPATGLKPDIQVDVNPEDERAYFEDAYKVLSKANVASIPSTNEAASTATNRPPSRRRLNEAELVRMMRDGINPDLDATNAAGRRTEPARSVVQDPALARALDLLKGLAVVQQFRSI